MQRNALARTNTRVHMHSHAYKHKHISAFLNVGNYINSAFIQFCRILEFAEKSEV